MPDLGMQVGDTVEIFLGDYFSLPPGCVELSRKWGDDIFEASSADPAVAVSIAANLTDLTVAAVAVADSVRVAGKAGVCPAVEVAGEDGQLAGPLPACRGREPADGGGNRPGLAGVHVGPPEGEVGGLPDRCFEVGGFRAGG